MSTLAVVHLVPHGSASLRAACGKSLGAGHTGHWPGGVAFAAKHDEPHCTECLRIEREGGWSA